MMEKKISMPAHLMYDGEDPRLFEHFSAVAQRTSVYTANDYADILEFLIRQWRLEELEGLIVRIFYESRLMVLMRIFLTPSHN
ncbi:hypothetical protein Fmac_032234 [Flemingia macrophylla]|uniref:Uncharacterized protein n=1 Tax=Flemingia macrophylla TaxID=520843 RepID=A0ABD1L4A9_9FABA